MMYKLVTWPESQRFMDYEWFREECYLVVALDGQEHHDSAYFVPEHRYLEVVSGVSIEQAFGHDDESIS